MDKISIIVPVYKVEQYLEKCIISLVEQTYENLEIILVDDGSPDNCGKICDEFAAKDARIVVIHKENAGVAMARNDGIEIATGDFISFVDSDDWMANDAYEKMIEVMHSENVDCVVGGCQVVYDKPSGLSYKKTNYRPARFEDNTETIKRLLLEGSAVWNRLFKKEIFDEIRFPVNRINDDEVVALHAYAECKKIYFLDETTYFYRIRSNSITTSSFSLRKVDVFYNAKENMAFVQDRFPELYEAAEYKFLMSMLYCYHNLRKLKSNDARQKQREFKEEIKSNKALFSRNKYLKFPYKVLAKIYSF